MIFRKFKIKIIIFIILFSYNQAFANDVAEMTGISEAAGNSAAAAASALSRSSSAMAARRSPSS